MLLPADLCADEGWVIVAEGECPDYTGASAANGTLGVLHWKEPFSVRQIVLNHIFEMNDNEGVNRAVQGVNPLNLRMYVDGNVVSDYTEWKQAIDMRNAEHQMSFKAAGSDKLIIK